MQHSPRSLPVKLKPAYKEELQQLYNEGIITPVCQQTEWTNSIVPVSKTDGSLMELSSLQGMVNYLKHCSSPLTQFAEPLKSFWGMQHYGARTQTSEGIWSHQAWPDKNPSASILWPKGRLHHTSGLVHEGPQSVLLQKCRPVIYASKRLTQAEAGYSNIRRELLSVVFGLETLQQYVFRSKIKVQIDHRPIIHIWKKSIAAASPQIQYLLLRLAKCDVELTYL